MQRLVFCVCLLCLSGCVDPQPTEALVDTTELGETEAPCRDHCVHRADAAQAACVRRGNSPDECASATRYHWLACLDGCDGSTCRSTCVERGKHAQRACIQAGGSVGRCAVKARRKTAQCARRCGPNPPPPCERPCRDASDEFLERCVAHGHSFARCAQGAERRRASCRARACAPRRCQDLRCRDEERCEMTPDGPTCVGLTCDDLECTGREHCQMGERGPACVLRTCDDVVCDDDQRCLLDERGPICVPRTCDDLVCDHGQRCQMGELGPMCVTRTCDDFVCGEGQQCRIEDGRAQCGPPDEPRDCVAICEPEANTVYARCVADGGRGDACANRAGDHNIRCQRACRDPESCRRDSCGRDALCVLGFDDRAVCVSVRDRACVAACEDDADALEQRCRDHGDDSDACATERSNFVDGCAGECRGDHVGCGDVACPDSHHCQERDDHPVCVPDQRPGCLTDCQNDGTEAYEQCVRDQRPNPECEQLGEQIIGDCSVHCPEQPQTCGQLGPCPNHYRCHESEAGPTCIDADPQCAWGCHVLRDNAFAVCTVYDDDEAACREDSQLGYAHCVRACQDLRQ